MNNNLTKRLLILLGILLVGLGSIFGLPKSPERPAPGVIMALPEYIGDLFEWQGQNADVTQREREILGPETTFARKLYTNSQGDSIYVSIVLGGQDMSASIHRPERCLPAQGYTVMDSRALKVALQPQPLSVTRLHNLRPIYTNDGKPLMLPDGKGLNEYNLMYYWFVGSTDTTSSHNGRYFIDARDRILKGYNQPWAYVTVMSRVTQNLKKYGRTDAETDAFLQDFIKKLAPVIQKSTVTTR